jgi:hypothetical protein
MPAGCLFARRPHPRLELYNNDPTTCGVRSSLESTILLLIP